MTGWSRAQQVLAHRAAAAAGWNATQRYIAMTHCGCPKDAGLGRPSATHRRNSRWSWECYMALAEASAKGRGAGQLMPPTLSGCSWHEAAERQRRHVADKIERVAAELTEAVPDVFAAGFLAGFIARMTARDDASLTFGREARCLDDLDDGQRYRVLEGLKAWGGRELARRGLRPLTFAPHASTRGHAATSPPRKPRKPRTEEPSAPVSAAQDAPRHPHRQRHGEPHETITTDSVGAAAHV